jgi:hypothetical protein
MWTNLAPLHVIQSAYWLIPKSPTYLVHDILDPSHHSCVVHHDDRSHLVVVNRVGLPQTTLLNFLLLMHFKMEDLGWFGTPNLHAKNSMWMKGNKPWVFTLAPPMCLDFQRELIGKFWGKSWTWTTFHEYSIYV